VTLNLFFPHASDSAVKKAALFLAAPEILKARSPVRNQDFPTDYTKVQAPSLLRIAGGYRCTMVPDRAIGLDCGC
jgi:hypothetical protein